MNNTSKHFTDDEIIARLPDGSLYLKPGVKRTKNYSLLDTGSQEESINYYDLAKNRLIEKQVKHGLLEEKNDETDNWE